MAVIGVVVEMIIEAVLLCYKCIAVSWTVTAWQWQCLHVAVSGVYSGTDVDDGSAVICYTVSISLQIFTAT